MLTCGIGQGDILAGSLTRAVLLLSVGKGGDTQFLFKLSWAGLDLGFGNKLINFFSLQKQSGPLKKKFKSHHRKPKNFKKAINGK